MNEKPILFSSEMVTAILEGRKNQTRRVVKPQPSWRFPGNYVRMHVMSFIRGIWYATVGYGAACESHAFINCPYGQPGDRLWVRETWKFLGTDMSKLGRTHLQQDVVVEYLADGDRRIIEIDWREAEKWMKRGNKSHSSIHLPRWASRITLEIANVRVERVQDITLEDINAEGTPYTLDPSKRPYGTRREQFQRLWDSINSKKHPWESNPWVWVIEFKKVEA